MDVPWHHHKLINWKLFTRNVKENQFVSLKQQMNFSKKPPHAVGIKELGWNIGLIVDNLCLNINYNCGSTYPKKIQYLVKFHYFQHK